MRFENLQRASSRGMDRLGERLEFHRAEGGFERCNHGAVLENRAEDLLLGLEVVVEEALGRFEFERDIIHSGARESFFGKNLQTGPEDLLAGALGTARADA